ncbi:hypothetical protein [Paraburkholderia humisilvae]|uniref:hypothetical protein n=1 Tax=Paraburkholderia humisilvae TaxID=627669 RepID=UPI0015841082|nr:hypothetical protein [Paraburkholderia humisilvae]
MQQEEVFFVVLHKRPDEKTTPYCYEVVYVYGKGSEIALAGDDGAIARNDRNYWISNIPRRQQSLLISIGRVIN